MWSLFRKEITTREILCQTIAFAHALGNTQCTQLHSRAFINVQLKYRAEVGRIVVISDLFVLLI